MSDTFQPGDPELVEPDRPSPGEPGQGAADEVDALAIFSEDAFQEYDEQPLIPPRRREVTPPVAPGALTDPAAVAAATAAATGRRSAGTAPAADGGPLAGLAPTPRTAAPASPEAERRTSRPASGGVPNHQKALLWTAGGIVAVLALIALFLLGTRLGAPAPVAAPDPVVTETSAPSETAAPEPVAGPVAPGVHDWTELRGGECLEPYTNPWAEEFTVVDCALPHRGQVLVRATFPGVDENTPFPTAAALQAQINVLCSDPAVIDLTVAGGYSDIQVDGSYAVTAAQWEDGLRDYTCFVSRTSGQPITESFVVTG